MAQAPQVYNRDPGSVVVMGICLEGIEAGVLGGALALFLFRRRSALPTTSRQRCACLPAVGGTSFASVHGLAPRLVASAWPCHGGEGAKREFISLGPGSIRGKDMR